MFQNTSGEKVEDNLIREGRFNEKFVLAGDTVDLLVKPRYMSRTRSNRDLHMFHMIAVKIIIPIPLDFIDIRISQMKNIVAEVNLQDFIPYAQDEAKLREETEILVLRDLLRLIGELK